MPGQFIGAKTLKLCKGAQGKSMMNTVGRLEQFVYKKVYLQDVGLMYYYLDKIHFKILRRNLAG